jgi:cytochrome c553
VGGAFRGGGAVKGSVLSPRARPSGSLLGMLLGLLLGSLLPLAVHGSPVPQQEFDQVLRSKPDLEHGEALFAACAACHGSQGGGVADYTVPAIAGQRFRVIARQLVDYRHDKRWDLRMQHFADQHHLSGPADIADVAAFVSRMPIVNAPDHGSGEFLQHGGELYARLCAACHGAAGEGDDRLDVPRLAGQHYAYLLRQMHDAVEHRRPNFPPDHIRLLKRLDFTDLTGVADYLSRLGS